MLTMRMIPMNFRISMQGALPEKPDENVSNASIAGAGTAKLNQCVRLILFSHGPNPNKGVSLLSLRRPAEVCLRPPPGV